MVIEELMYNQDLLKPKFDIYDFVEYAERAINPDEEGYEPIPEALEYFRNLEIPKKWTEKITELYQDGEDEVYNIQSFDDVENFPRLKRITAFNINDEVCEFLKNKGIEIGN